MIHFDYMCSNCGSRENTKTIESFVCKCGGTMRISNDLEMQVFKPYYSEDLGVQVNSAHDETRLLREHGLSYSHDHRQMRQRRLHIYKHREEIIKDRYAKVGVKYEPKSKCSFNEKTGEFTPHSGERKRKAFFYAALLCLFISVPSFAIEGVDYTDLLINGIVYQVPKANKDYIQELYYLKKALSGDKDALDIFVGQGEYRDFFIGDETSRWVRVYKEGKAEITEY